METELKASLLLICERFAGLTGLKASTIGMRAARDARFFDRLREGGGFTAATYDRVMAYFAANWPADAVWPETVPRPAAAEA